MKQVVSDKWGTDSGNDTRKTGYDEYPPPGLDNSYEHSTIRYPWKSNLLGPFLLTAFTLSHV